MGEIRYGPGGLPEAPTFEEAFAALAAEGYRACEVGFVSGFWLDYGGAPPFGAGFAALAGGGYRACEVGFVSGFWLDYEAAPLFGAAAAAADVALSVHA